jgi:transposase
MMGQRCGDQDQLFYSFNLDAHVPADHLLRGIDRFLDLSELRQHLAPFYSHTGRPSIDPELMVRMLIVGYSFGIRSERRLCEEIHLNLAYRWFCRLGLEHPVPDHSTFSRNRHGRFRDSDAFRHLFETVVARCMKEGLVGGEGFAVDASLIEADANRSRSMAREEAGDLRDPRHATRAVREYLAALDAQDKPGTAPASISPTDPAARWTAVGGPAFYAYSTNYLIDVQAGIIVDVEATPAWRTAEVNSTRTMIERVEQRFELKPERLIGDMAYGAADLLGWMVNEKAIEPHVPVWDKTQRDDDSLSSTEFQWDAPADEPSRALDYLSALLANGWRSPPVPAYRSITETVGCITRRSRGSGCDPSMPSKCCSSKCFTCPRRRTYAHTCGAIHRNALIAAALTSATRAALPPFDRAARRDLFTIFRVARAR